MKQIIFTLLMGLSLGSYAASLRIKEDVTFYPNHGKMESQIKKHYNPLELNFAFINAGLIQIADYRSIDMEKEATFGINFRIVSRIDESKSLEKVVLKAGTYEINCGQTYANSDLTGGPSKSRKFIIQNFNLKNTNVVFINTKGRKWHSDNVRLDFTASALNLTPEDSNCESVITKSLEAVKYFDEDVIFSVQ